MRLEQILIEYSQENNLDHTLKIDQDNKCMMTVNEINTVVFERALARNGYYIYAAIGRIPPEREAEIAILALESNLFGLETGLSQLGYAKDQRLLVLFTYLEEENVDYENFKKVFKNFTDHLLHWNEKFASILKAETAHIPQSNDKKNILFA